MNSQYTLTNPYQNRPRQPPPPPPETNLTPYEETLRAEVIYLHSLWHQGPPPPEHPPPLPFHHHHQGNYPPPSRALHVLTNPRPFKKKKKKRKGSTTMNVDEPDSGPEWLVLSPVPESQGWPAFNVLDRPQKPDSNEVQTVISDRGMQKDVVECCRKYFYGKIVDGSEPESEEEEDEEYLSDEDEEEEEDDEGEEGRDFEFLLNLFVERRELREYYEKKQESGALYCLVCGGIGVKVWKSFRGCLSLVQHCNGIEKTKRRRAHRALAQVVCKVLGWDFDRLPDVVLKGEPLGRSLATSGQEQVEKDEKNMDHGNGCVESGNVGDKFVVEEVSDDAEMKGEMVDSEICPGHHVTDKLVGDRGSGVDATGGCGKPVNHEALLFENRGEEVYEGVHTLSVSAESSKEEGYVDPLTGDQDALKNLVARCNDSSAEEVSKLDGIEEAREKKLSKKHERDEDGTDVGSEKRDLKRNKVLADNGEDEVSVTFSRSDIKNKYKDALLVPRWKAYQTLIFLEQDDGLHRSDKIAAFDFDGCLAKTSVKRLGANAWSLRYPSIPEKLQSLYDDGYKLVIFTNESKKGKSKVGRLNNFIKLVKVPMQSDRTTEDPFRKPKPGMWRIMEKHFNSGISIDMDKSFYVGDAAGRDGDHSNADIKFAEAVGLKFHVPEDFFEA